MTHPQHSSANVHHQLPKLMVYVQPTAQSTDSHSVHLSVGRVIVSVTAGLQPAIVYADVAGYSRLNGEDEEATHRVRREFLDLIATTVVG